MENCIGVTYTATQSTLELFKLEVVYSSTSCFTKIARLQRVAYTATQSTLELFKLEVDYSLTSCFSKSEKLKMNHLYKQSTTGLFKLEVNYSSTFFQQKCKIA